ncbi:fimbrial protein [Pseudomonas silvicola]|nr:fimbrial protein [Pseudomonas silvicola]
MSRFEGYVRPSRVGRLLGAIGMLASLVLSSSAWAVCGMMPNYQEGAVVDIGMGKISVPSGTAVGEVFYSQEFPIAGTFFAIVSCKPGDTTEWRVMQGTSTAIKNVYTTNIAGVGMRTSWLQARSTTPFYAGDKTTWNLGMPGTSGSVAQNTLVFNVTGSVVVELIKLSDTVGSGALAAGTYTNNIAYATYPFNSGIFLTTRITGGGSEIVPETGTCDIGDLSVNLPDVPASRFNGVGSTHGDTDFPVTFTCKGSNGAVTLTIDADRWVADGSLGLLKPQSSSEGASCVALQILDATSNLPVVLGDTAVVGAVLNSTAAFNLPYRVRYYQSGAGSHCVTAGLVKGTATVKVSYQ